MQFSIVAALSFAASVSALPSRFASLAGKVKTLQASSASNYTWTVTNWTASEDSYSFSVSAPATTQGNIPIPAFQASCSGKGAGTGATPCTGTRSNKTSSAEVNAYLEPSNDTSAAHLAVSYEYSTIEGQWGVTYNYTAFSTQPYEDVAIFTVVPTKIWGVE